MEYPPCKYCGASHGMGIEETATGKIEPIDICYDCLWKGFPNYVQWGGDVRSWETGGKVVNMAEELKTLEQEIIKNG